MKCSKMTALLLTGALAALLCACGQSGDSAPQAEPAQSAAPTAPPAETAPEAPAETPAGTDDDGSGLRQLSGDTAAGRYRANQSSTDQTWLFTYTDYATGAQVPLCSAPNCTHDSDACPAWLPAQTSSAELYALEDGTLLACLFAEDSGSLYRLQADGSGRTLLAQEAAGAGGTMPNWGVPFTDGEAVYFLRTAMANGGMAGLLQRLSLADGALETQWQADGWNRVQGASGRDLVLKVEDYSQVDAIPQPEIPEGASLEEAQRLQEEYQAQVNAAGYLSRVYLKSVDTGAEQDVLATSLPMDGSDERCFTWQNGALYWFDKTGFGALHQVRAGADGSFADQTIALEWPVSVPEGGSCSLSFDTACPALGGVLLVRAQLTGADYADFETRRFAVDPAAGTVWEIPLYYVAGDGLHPVDILAQTGESLLVQYELGAEDWQTIQADGTVQPVELRTGRYGLIAAQDFLAGEANYQSLTDTMAGSSY